MKLIELILLVRFLLYNWNRVNQMKVLTIKQPYAELIGECIKRFEIRSRKTHYRGELYIHSSLTKIKFGSRKNDFLKYLNNEELEYGYILFKCTISDCVYIDEKFLKIMKQNTPDNLYNDDCIGNYAWVIENVVPIDNKIKSRGNLGIWNYYTDEEIMKLMAQISYGWIDKYDNRNYEVNEDFSNNYILQSPQQVLWTKIGVCWDQVELERYYFDNTKINKKTYFLCYYDDNKCPTHTFLVYEKNNCYYWFEHSWEKYRCIHTFNSIQDLLNNVKTKFIESELNNTMKKTI